MQHLWIQDPYCWLHSDELVAACQGKSPLKDFWFKLWHALDIWKHEANKQNSRIFARHEIQPLAVPATPVESVPHAACDAEDSRPTITRRPTPVAIIAQYIVQSSLNTLCAFLAKWPAWPETINFICPHHYRSRKGS